MYGNYECKWTQRSTLVLAYLATPYVYTSCKHVWELTHVNIHVIYMWNLLDFKQYNSNFRPGWYISIFQQLKKGVFRKGSFRNLFAELCFVFFCALRWFSPANLTEISFRNCPSKAGIFWKTPSRKTPKRSCWILSPAFVLQKVTGWLCRFLCLP